MSELLVITFPATTGTAIDNRHAGAFVLFDAAQQAPQVTATAGANTGTNPVNTNISPSTGGSMIVDVSTRGNLGSFTTTQTGQTELWDQSCGNLGSSSAGSVKPVAAAGQTTLGWSHTNANRYAHALAAFAPAPSGTFTVEETTSTSSTTTTTLDD